MTSRFKIVVFGNAAVGKTTLIHKIMTGSFLENTHVTIGVEFHVKKLEIDGADITLQVWDFGGEDRFNFMLPMYLNGARGGVFVYEITNPNSLYDFSRWMKVIKNSNPALPILIVGTKSDLVDLRKVTLEEANAVVKEIYPGDVIEVSAKTGQNVGNLLESLTRTIIEQSSKAPLLTPLTRQVSV